MDKKYIGATVVLSKETTERIDAVCETLKAQVGFQVSRADAIAHLLHVWDLANPKTTETK